MELSQSDFNIHVHVMVCPSGYVLVKILLTFTDEDLEWID